MLMQYEDSALTPLRRTIFSEQINMRWLIIAKLRL